MITKYKLFENKYNVLNIGAKVICSKGIQDGFEVGGLIGVIRLIRYDDAGNINGICKSGYLSYNLHFKKSDNKGKLLNESWWVHHSLVHLYDEDLEKQRQEKIERLRLKYKDIDPLGEEDWGDEED